VSNPSAVNRRKYARAQEYIRSGDWIVDPSLGVIRSRRTGRPLRTRNFRGYLHYGVTLPGGSRASCQCLPVRVARVIYEAVHGPVPEGLQVNHKDGNKANNSIANLEAITPLENIEHSIRTGLRGPQPRGEQVHASKLSESQVVEIRALLADGLTQQVIADRYGVAQATISWIKLRKTWRHVT
jgi:hypothetical protein